MYKIIYFPGTYGAFLEFAINQCTVKNNSAGHVVVSELGTCHDAVWANRKNSKLELNFISYHESNITKDEKFILIDFDQHDDVLVLQLRMKRAGNANLDIQGLETNTHSKLINQTQVYRNHSPLHIIDRINKFSDISPYNNIKDPAWPDITSVDDFYNLPKWIVDECVNTFGFRPFYLSEHRPHAPKWALRQMFKLWFMDLPSRPSTQIESYTKFSGVYRLNLNKMFDINQLQQEFLSIGRYFDLDIDIKNFPLDIYNKVVSVTTYKESRNKCDQIINAVKNGTTVPIDLNIFEEGFITYILESKFDLEIPMEKENFFSNTGEIIETLNK